MLLCFYKFNIIWSIPWLLRHPQMKDIGNDYVIVFFRMELNLFTITKYWNSC